MKFIVKERIFTDSKHEAVKWFHTHPCSLVNKKLILIYHPTGIGSVVEATCSCGRIKDVTDYLSW